MGYTRGHIDRAAEATGCCNSTESLDCTAATPIFAHAVSWLHSWQTSHAEHSVKENVQRCLLRLNVLPAGASDSQTLANWLMEHPAQIDHGAAAGARREGDAPRPQDFTVIEDDTPQDKQEDARLSFPVSSLPPPLTLRIDAPPPAVAPTIS